METIVRLLLDEDLLQGIFLHAAWVGPLLGLLVGLGLARRTGDDRYYLTRGLALGLLGTLNWVLWILYGAITDRLGLDTVRNLLVNLALFVAVGLAIGFVWRRLPPRSPSGTDGSPAPPA